MGVVEQHIFEAVKQPGALAHYPEALADQVACVRDTRVGQHPLVGPVHLRELELEPCLRRLGARFPKARSPGGVILGTDQMRLQPVDLADEACE